MNDQSEKRDELRRLIIAYGNLSNDEAKSLLEELNAAAREADENGGDGWMDLDLSAQPSHKPNWNTKPGATSALVLGHFATEREAYLARDRALILIYGDAADTKFSPEESEHVILSDQAMRQIKALKEGRGRLH
jgi:hypothetical protein